MSDPTETTSIRPRYFWWAAALIVLAGLGLRVWQLGEASLWYDEAETQTWEQAAWGKFFSLVLESGNQTPLYFALLHLLPTETEFWLRLPSAVAGVAGIILLMFVTSKLYGNDHLALIMGALLAFNPYHIWFSRNARPYTLLLVVTLLASYFFLLLLRGERSRANWFAFTVCSMAAYMTHYFAAALPLAQYILFAFILRGNRGFFRRWLRAQIIAAIPLMIWVVALLRRETVALAISWIPRPGLADPFLTVWNLTLDYSGSLTWYAVPGLAAILAGLLPGLYYGFRERRTNLVNFYWFWLLVAPIVTTLAVSLVVRPLYVDRYFMVFLPALLILMAYGWTRLSFRRAVPAALAIVVAAGLANVFTALRNNSDERQAWRSAAQYVASNDRPGDGFIMSAQIVLLSFSIYFDGQDILNRTLLFDMEGAGPEGAPVRGEWQPVTRLWVIYTNPDETSHNEGVMLNRDPFEDDGSVMFRWLNGRRDQIVSRRDFRGVTVFLVDVTADVYNTDEFGD